MKITLSGKNLNRVVIAASKEKNRTQLTTVFVKDVLIDNKPTRFYISTNGRVLLRCQEEIEKIELEKGLLIEAESINKKELYDREFEMSQDGTYLSNREYGILKLNTHDIFPNILKIIEDNIDISKLKKPSVFRWFKSETISILEKFFESKVSYGIGSLYCKVDSESDFLISYNEKTKDVAVIQPMRLG